VPGWKLNLGGMFVVVFLAISAEHVRRILLHRYPVAWLSSRPRFVNFVSVMVPALVAALSITIAAYAL